MARPVDLDRREALLDQVVDYLGEHGLANLSLRPLAEGSINTASAKAVSVGWTAGSAQTRSPFSRPICIIRNGGNE